MKREFVQPCAGQNSEFTDRKRERETERSKIERDGERGREGERGEREGGREGKESGKRGER